MTPESREESIYTKRWRERREKEQQMEKQRKKEEVDKILPGVKFEGENEYTGFKFEYKGVELQMNFRNYEALVNAVSYVSKILLAYENREDKTKTPKFYLKGMKINLDDGIIWDTTYLENGVSAFLGPRNNIKSELQKLVDFLNALKDM